MPKPIAWARRAAGHLISIRRYIAVSNPDAAKSTAHRIKETTRAISEHPQIGRVGRDSGTREFPVPGTPYIIVYMVRDVVEIVAVLHGAQVI
ncbi:MAG: type II toxin-antitoxin system RelE/ParE family toxin [Elusimicrobia bacterium]|nr:type II toxin-antitoxin system RelE/ParE family toxin [Elusimicrobiota bacterium]